MRVFGIMLAFIASIVLVSSVMAVPPGKELEFKDGKMGKVVFSGKVHADKGKKCNDCHPKIFKMKKGTAKIKFPDHNAGKEYCFACHNGTTAWKPAGNCNKCHKKE